MALRQLEIVEAKVARRPYEYTRFDKNGKEETKTGFEKIGYKTIFSNGASALLFQQWRTRTLKDGSEERYFIQSVTVETGVSPSEGLTPWSAPRTEQQKFSGMSLEQFSRDFGARMVALAKIGWAQAMLEEACS